MRAQDPEAQLLKAIKIVQSSLQNCDFRNANARGCEKPGLNGCTTVASIDSDILNSVQADSARCPEKLEP